MADNLSRGTLRISDLSLDEINYVFERIRDELDELQGLRGPVTINDDVTVNDNVTSRAIKVTDSDGNLLHGMGDI